MNRIRPLLLGFLRDERGATAIEYGLIGVLVSLSIIIGAQPIGQFIANVLETIRAALAT